MFTRLSLIFCFDVVRTVVLYAMAGIAEFLKSPSEKILDGYTKEQLLKIAEHFDIDIGDKRLKDTVKSVLKANLFERKVLEEGTEISSLACTVDAASINPSACALTFEQQREMLILQLRHDEVMQKAEIEKQLHVEKLHFETEQAKIALEQHRLELIKDGTLTSDRSVGLEVASSVPSRDESFDVLGNLRLLPKFSERDPESFFLFI